MTAKQWLMRARKLECRIASLEAAKQRAYDRAISVTTRPKEVNVKGGGSADNSAAYVIVDESVKAQMDRLNRVKAEILEAIGMVSDNVLATLLTEYYVNGRTWEEVAVAIGHSVRQVHRAFHPKALRIIEDVIECHNG